MVGGGCLSLPTDGLNLFYRDITARKQDQEEHLRRSEERYRSLVEATAEIVWTNSPEGEMRGPQPGWGGFTGQTEAQYRGYGWAQAVHPEDAQPTVDAWNQAVAARRPFLFEHRVRRHDGVYRHLRHPRRRRAGRMTGSIREWVGVHTDVTERRAIEAAREALLAQQGVFLRDVLSSVTEGKLLLSTSPSHLPPPLPPVGSPSRSRGRAGCATFGYGHKRWLRPQATRRSGSSTCSRR